MSKRRGGLYVWRTDKPHAFLGLPIIGRHFAYAGMTNSYYHREQQHLGGSVKYGTTAARWSDLRPKCYRIPLPDFILHGHYRRKITKALETVLIWTVCPVYNDTQQAPYNLRKISRTKAAAQRDLRDQYGVAYRAVKGATRWAVWAALIALVTYVWMETH